MTESRTKLFIQNFFVYGIGGIISKAIPILMLPIVTRLMPDTTYFGINDMATVMQQFGSSIVILGMYDSMFRLFFEKEEETYKKIICSTTAIFTLGMSILACLLIFLLKEPLSKIFFGSYSYTYLVIIVALNISTSANNTIISAPTRMQNKRRIFLLTNTLSPALSYLIAIPLLLNGYYILALPLASLLAAVSLLIIFATLNHKWFRLSLFQIQYLKPLLTIALPLVPNFLVYWIFSSCDRLMIANILGHSQEGVYAIGGKVGQVSNLIYQAFAGGWQYFAFSTMKDEDQVQMTGRIFEYLGIISFIAGAFMMACNEWLFTLIFTGDYQNGQIVAPYLFISPLLLMLFQTSCNQFLVIKKTWPNILILLGGALLNVILNWILIPRIGIEGAAIATLAGYVLSVVVCVFALKKMNLIVIRFRFTAATGGFILLGICWRFFLNGKNLALLFLAIVMAIFDIKLYKDDLKLLFYKK